MYTEGNYLAKGVSPCGLSHAEAQRRARRACPSGQRPALRADPGSPSGRGPGETVRGAGLLTVELLRPGIPASLTPAPAIERRTAPADARHTGLRTRTGGQPVSLYRAPAGTFPLGGDC